MLCGKMRWSNLKPSCYQFSSIWFDFFLIYLVETNPIHQSTKIIDLMKTRYYSILLLMSLSFAGSLFAQDDKKPPKRPDNISVSDYDGFKNSSFDIMDNAIKLKQNFGTIDNEVKKYSGIINTLTVDKIRKDLGALRGIQKESTVLTQKIGQLDDLGKGLLTSAGSVTPKLKSIAASSNTKKAVQGLTHAKDNLGTVSSGLAADVTLLTDELKKRNEPIE